MWRKTCVERDIYAERGMCGGRDIYEERGMYGGRDTYAERGMCGGRDMRGERRVERHMCGDTCVERHPPHTYTRVSARV